ncbi:MAG: alpha-L-fucosidase, partial [Candidatus Hydrogenedentes bacterium]|nr:alpha-L-fucosidase [Candidatus Hydrogenedentota bacterium]
MNDERVSRRGLFKRGMAGASLCALAAGDDAAAAQEAPAGPGAQRLSVERLQAWEALGYGMFIHFGMSTFVGQELPDGKAPPATYAPDRLDVDQWVSVARDAGMKYAVLTAKHVAGHCLWPSEHTDYTVAVSGDTTDVIAQFVEACRKRGVLPGLYYCSWDNHNRFGSKTPSDPREGTPAYTTSLYQTFQTAQIAELLARYGPLAEMWIDIPGVLGRGYRTYLYGRVAELQPDIVIMMNSGISDGGEYNVDYAWPSDLIAIERWLPPETGHTKWREIEGGRYYLPGEVCDPIGKDWFYVEGDVPRPDGELLEQLTACRARGANFLLDVPPDTHGRIPDDTVQALMRL